ncbi:MAG: glycerol-3-phosphate dehydrogenase/oxidase [Nitrosomonas sp.]|nr:glycerol-3-phosphate dehydrogenase/oxidase [Nitrosomonas sp.]
MNRNPSALGNQSFDLLVCGGGIYGAWTAYDAALRGLRVALIDRGDWGNATSSASSKLVHGGLRYLEQFEFKLVRKALAEREMLMKVAPYRVWPLRFGVPVYAHSRIGRLRLKLGLTLYDLLAANQTTIVEWHRFFSRNCFAARFPLLNTDKLNCGFTYADAQTDDARLVLELVDGAIETGAVCVNYCELINVIEEDGYVSGAYLVDRLTNQPYKIQTRQIVFATGRWQSADHQVQQDCQLTRGIHLILPSLLADEALLLTAPSDGRVFFVIPWYGLTLLGTTDTSYQGKLDEIEVDQSDIAYLLDAVNAYLQTPWSEADIIGAFAGIRVLKTASASESGAAPSSVSRDWTLKTAANGVHYSIGGKLTSARQDAAQIVDHVCTVLGIKASCATQNRLFPWYPHELQGKFSEWSQAMQKQLIQSGVDAESAYWLIRRHGGNVPAILQEIARQPALAERIIPSLPFITADLMHCVVNEMTVHLDDVLRRRIPLLILAKLTESDLYRITDHISGVLHWDAARCQQEIARCRTGLNS